VFKNRILRKIFGHTRQELIGNCRKLGNNTLHALYSSTNIIKTLKSRMTRWVEHVACIGKLRNVYKFLVVKPARKRDHSEDPQYGNRRAVFVCQHSTSWKFTACTFSKTVTSECPSRTVGM
jgi:hypothetical protein